ncbi:MAG TPA: potassium transporter TrkG [Thermomicrobiales bacterium]|nr:potassium transporter TrkG [Thermomicrobiales bacterium]
MVSPGPHRQRRPGDRVIRRRVDAQQVMELPPPPRRRPVPTARSNAKVFALAYIMLVAIGTVLLSSPLASESREWTPLVDALFTAISATAVTGLVTVPTQEHWSFFGEALILLMIQAGGMGFMVGASLVLITLRRSSSLRGSLIMRDGAPTLSLSEARMLTGRILRFMLVVEAIGATLLAVEYSPESDGIFDAIWWGTFHAVSAFCNAGFDLQSGGRSLYGFRESFLINLTVMSLVQLGALSFMFFADLWQRKIWLSPVHWHPRRFWYELQMDSKLILIANYSLVLFGAIAFMIIEWNTGLSHIPWALDKVVASFFQSVSARTAGFATISFSETQSGTLFLWLGMMLIGGAAASTAGGVKLATFSVVVLAVLSTVRGQVEPQFGGRRIPTVLVFRAMTIIAIFLIVHFFLTLSLVFTEDVLNREDFSFLSLMFETMSALATVGVSTGLTGDLSSAGKLVLCVAMFVGRLGPLTAVYALQRRESRQDYRYPEAWVRMG